MIQVEIIVPLFLAHKVKPFLEQCCSESGDLLLGYRESQEVNEEVFIVQLTHDSHSSQHVSVLHDALQQETISSFRFLRGSLLKLSSPTIVKQISDFPLAVGDSWVTALDNPECIYLSVPRTLITGKQSAWLLSQENVVWDYL